MMPGSGTVLTTQRAVCWTGLLAVILRGMEGVPSGSNVRLGWILTFFRSRRVLAMDLESASDPLPYYKK
jgi:hypothetical protein